MAPNGQPMLNPGDLLEILKSRPPLEAFQLSLVTAEDRVIAGTQRPCGSEGAFPFCREMCAGIREGARKIAISTGRPAIHSCAPGLFNFLVPFDLDSHGTICLQGGGVRDRTSPPFPQELLEEIDEASLRKQLEQLPALTRQEVEEAAAEAQRLLPPLLEQNVHALTLEKFSRRIRAVSDISREIEQAANLESLVQQVCETMVVFFDAPRVATLLFDRDGRKLQIRGGLGIPADLSPCPADQAHNLLPETGSRQIPREAIEALFPGLRENLATCSPLFSGNQLLGWLILFRVDLQGQDLLLLDLLAERTATWLARQRREENLLLESSINGRLITVISTLSLIENRDELHHSMISAAADLLQAACGSLMLLDDAGEHLRIAASKGMSLPLARSMSVRVGTGISGKVAKSGFPLLVQDIEKDSRVGISNRPRFRTNSFISIPIRPKGELIGVLNLADKEDGGVFGEADLKLLGTFVAHAGILLERINTLERASLLEELSVTDPLTGLFNRRFLEKRLEEEMSRSGRQNFRFSLVLLDLDHFKIYNDLCGHLAGDAALKKVATVLKSSAREMDVLTRFGGEEFCLILPGTSKEESVLVAERVRRSIEREPFPQESRLPLKRLTASLGIASFPDDASTASTLIHAADMALYQAKSAGRNRIVLYQSALEDRKDEWMQSAASGTHS